DAENPLMMPATGPEKQLLLIGASRGLGFALAEQYLQRGWHVVATQRAPGNSNLPALAKTHRSQLEIETVDIVYPEQVNALRARLGQRSFDMLFVNVGVKNDDSETIATVSTDEFVRVMV